MWIRAFCLFLSSFLCISFNTQAIVRYVDANCSTPLAPYTNWTTASTDIQSAVDAASAGDLILVTNGNYATGGRVFNRSLTNRVIINQAVTLQSINGPAATIISGYQVPVTTNDFGAIRCVYLGSGATLSGFTIANGATEPGNDDGIYDSFGGGVFCEVADSVVTNCVLTSNSAGDAGGGVSGGTVNNCTFNANSTTLYGYSGGGGAYGSVLNNCLFTGNISDVGGAAIYCTLNDCTVANNSAISGGGVAASTLANCIVYDNAVSSDGTNYSSCAINYCCTLPLPDDGAGNFTNDPVFVNLAGGDFHLQSNSFCINGGCNAHAVGTNDLDGQARIFDGIVDVGAYEFQVAIPLTSIALQVTYTNFVTGFNVQVTGSVHGGVVASSTLDFGDGTILSNQLSSAHAWAFGGDCQIVLTAFNPETPGGISATSMVHIVDQPVQYVSLDSTNPVAPYVSWLTAATNIQDAVDTACTGGAIMVSNGVYQFGCRTNDQTADGSTNRLVVDKPVMVLSVNGPDYTSIDGGTNFRCVYLVSNSSLTGFSLVNGMPPGNGGGLLAASDSVMVSNCVMAGNTGGAGGGASGGTLYDCTFLTNSASSGGGAANSILNRCTLIANGAWNGGGALSSTLNDCVLIENHGYYSGGGESCYFNHCMLTNNTGENHGGGGSGCTFNNCTLAGNSSFYGGGAAYSSLTNCLLVTNGAGWGGAMYNGSLLNCMIISNTASFYGGGVIYATLNGCTLLGNSVGSDGGGVNSCDLVNCLLAGNSAGSEGGGAISSTLNNCTVVNNSAVVSSGGAGYSTLNNCISYYNTNSDFYQSVLDHCCTAVPPTNSFGNITNEPLFLNLAAGDYHLETNSPCINSGNNATVFITNDFEGNPRIAGSTVDLGAYEFQSPTSLLSYAFLQQAGLPVDGSADFVDSDGDGLNNWQEWKAGTNPVDANSALTMTTVSNGVDGITVSWQSVSGVTYILQRSTNWPVFTTIQGGILGQPGSTSYTDSDATNYVSGYYRVGVQ